jgi:hypothetical protein
MKESKNSNGQQFHQYQQISPEIMLHNQIVYVELILLVHVFN